MTEHWKLSDLNFTNIESTQKIAADPAVITDCYQICYIAGTTQIQKLVGGGGDIVVWCGVVIPYQGV